MVTKRRSQTKRKTTKRKATKRKATKRKTTKRKTTKRKVTKKKTTKRKTIRRKAAPKSSKKGLESKIAELEAQLSKLSTEAQAPPPPPPPPAQTAPPPKAEAPKPAPKPQAAPPANLQQALENAWQNVPMGNWNEQKGKVTGYVPENNRAWARRHAPRGTAASSGDWNVQKAKVTGYAPASNQYFATRQRLSYNPPDKNFGSFGLAVEGATAQTQSAPPPQQPAETSSTSASSSYPKTKQELLEEYEKDYLTRLAQQDAEDAQAVEAAPKEKLPTQGSLPKGF